MRMTWIALPVFAVLFGAISWTVSRVDPDHVMERTLLGAAGGIAFGAVISLLLSLPRAWGIGLFILLMVTRPFRLITAGGLPVGLSVLLLLAIAAGVLAVNVVVVRRRKRVAQPQAR